MPQQNLDHPDIGVLLQKMRRKAVAKGIGDTCLPISAMRPRVCAARLSWRAVIGLIGFIPETASPAACRVVPGAQQLKQMRRKHHVAIFVALTLFDPDYHALAVDVGYLQRDHLGHAQSGPDEATLNAALYLSPGAASRKRATSSGLSSTGSLRG